MDTIRKSSETGYALPALLYITSKGLERASYYGLRAILIMYMLGETMQMSNDAAFRLYGALALIIAFTQLLGGLVGDLLIGNKNTAMLGGLLQALGAFVICIPSIATLYVGIGLISLGSGLYGPNILSQFGKLFLDKEDKMDSGFTLLYWVINIAATLGVLIIGFLGENSFYLGFIACGILTLISIVPLYLINEQKVEEVDYPGKRSLSNNLILVVIAIVVSSLFWSTYEIGARELSFISYNLSNQLPLNIPTGILSGLSSATIIIFGIIAVFIWWFISVNRFIKLGAGFIAVALSFVILLLMPEKGYDGGMLFFLMSLILLGFAEILIAPTINSMITISTNPKYLAIVFGVAFLPVRLLHYIVGLFTEFFYDRPNLSIILGAIFMFLIGMALLIGFLLIKLTGKQSVD